MGGNPLSYIDPDGQFAINVAGGVFGFISGSVGGYISSGGDFNSAFQGGLAGGVVGLVNPLGGLAGIFLGNASASAVGQVVGNFSSCNDPLDIDLGVAVASGIGGTFGAGIGHYLSVPTRSSSAFVITQGLGPSRPFVREFFESIVEGSVGGVTEFLSSPPSSIGSKNNCECR